MVIITSENRMNTGEQQKGTDPRNAQNPEFNFCDGYSRKSQMKTSTFHSKVALPENVAILSEMQKVARDLGLKVQTQENPTLMGTIMTSSSI